ncbi:MAG: DUF2953 domain-containing protein [Eubacterium sp.]|nr:DUF2953 domain-containing protein [Eubacterium sp.]
MAVLSTLLHVLLIIGKVLLVIILAVLALLLLLILAPYCYKAQIKADKEHFRAEGGVSWLLFVARVRFRLLDEQKDFEVYLLGIPVLRLLRLIKNRKNRSATKQTESAQDSPAVIQKTGTAQGTADKTQAQAASGQETDGSGPERTQPSQAESAGGAEVTQLSQAKSADGAETIQPARTESSDLTEVTEPAQERTDVQDHLSEKQQDPESAQKQSGAEQKADVKRQRDAAREQKKASREQKKAARAQKLEARKNAHRQKKAGGGSGKERASGKIRAILEKVRWGFRLIRTEMFREAFTAVKTGGIRVLKHVLPRRISGFIRFGLSDPARTGQICGILAMLYPKMPEKLEVIPDFREACFEADTVFKGRVFLIYFIIQGLKIILNKNVRLLIKVVRQKVPLEKVIAAENRRSGGNKNGK